MLVNRDDVVNYVTRNYEVKSDYPWQNFPHFATLRHNKNKKWFGLIMNITEDKLGLKSFEEVDVLNVKVDKAFIGPLTKKKGIYKAYHMNKTTWITINLREISNLHYITDLIDESFELTV